MTRPLIQRELAGELKRAASEYPVVTLLGPRQSGKTTLARQTFPEKPWISLEDPDVRLAAEADPRGFFANHPKGAILDEVQRLPELLPYIQGIVDRSSDRGLFILTGSHQPRLHEAIAQSLAGRTAVLTLWPLSLAELRQDKPTPDAFDLVIRGTYPRVHAEQIEARRFYNAYIQTYVERDVRAMIRLRDLNTFHKFLVLLAGRIGQIVNLSSLATDTGVSATTLRDWLSILEASYLIIRLPPWYANVGKRLVKSPKLYFADTGLAAFLLGIHDADQARRDPLRGALYENLIVGDVVRQFSNVGLRPDLYFYRDSHGNEVDLLIRESRRITPVEIKSASTFSMEFLKGLKHFAALPQDTELQPGVVLYDGPGMQSVQGVRIWNPMESLGQDRAGGGPR
jgi:predicted AAA+ superfamily ATPase